MFSNVFRKSEPWTVISITEKNKRLREDIIAVPLTDEYQQDEPDNEGEDEEEGSMALDANNSHTTVINIGPSCGGGDNDDDDDDDNDDDDELLPDQRTINNVLINEDIFFRRHLVDDEINTDSSVVSYNNGSSSNNTNSSSNVNHNDGRCCVRSSKRIRLPSQMYGWKYYRIKSSYR